MKFSATQCKLWLSYYVPSLFFLHVLLIIPGAAAAQQKTILGKVIDAVTKTPLLGVTIKLDDKNGTTVTTDKQGGFVLDNGAIGQSLTFSFLGYSSQTIKIDTRTSYTIALAPISNVIEETVVVGYGRQKKRNLTGAIVSVGASEIEKTTLQDPISILQGRAAGVQVSSNSGAPGGEMSIRVRGSSSLNSGNNPLFVVDGIPLESNSISSLNGTENSGLNPMADINPSDIASIEVLKDAASTAIYGSRAANGVVMITTKRGAAGKPEVILNANAGVSSLTRKLSVLNARQYR